MEKREEIYYATCMHIMEYYYVVSCILVMLLAKMHVNCVLLHISQLHTLDRRYKHCTRLPWWQAGMHACIPVQIENSGLQ